MRSNLEIVREHLRNPRPFYKGVFIPLAGSIGGQIVAECCSISNVKLEFGGDIH